MDLKSKRSEPGIPFFLTGLALVLVAGYFTYFRHYEEPPAFFWDENYHVASAQKYLNGVFFMEPHPPLGKLIVAAGEWLVAPNDLTTQLLDLDYAAETPDGLSLAGFRFFPALLAWLTAGLLYLLFVEVTGRAWLSTFLTAPYIFDNAIIVHSRGAMLEGPQLFFLLLGVYAFVRILRQKGSAALIQFLFLGVAVGLSASVKLNSLIIVPTILLAAWRQHELRERATALAVGGIASALVFCAVWQLHFSLGKNVRPVLRNDGFYQASAPFREALSRGEAPPFFVAIRDSMRFTADYTAKVPRLDLCKEGENGSHPLMWPLGGAAINYRWEKEGGEVRYQYLQSNPAGWLLALGAVLFLTACLIGSIFRISSRIPFEAEVLVTLYWIYFATVLNAGRVLYLYHYFIPLLFAYLLIPHAVSRLLAEPEIQMSPRPLFAVVSAAAAIFGCYLFFAPFTYALPLTNEEFMRRSWFSIWRLQCIGCPPAEKLQCGPVPSAN